MQRISQVQQAPADQDIRAGLTNYPVNVTLTIRVDDRREAVFKLENEEDARNLLARLVPVELFEANPESVMTFISDGTEPMYDFLLEEGKKLGLSLPEGI